MKVSSRGYGDAVRGLSHGKGAKVSLGRGTPAKREGSDGDLTLRNTDRGVILYAKYGGHWYSIHTSQPLVAGMIIMWAGTVATIPGNWAICDGNNGTPDLRSRFIIASGTTDTYAGLGSKVDPGDNYLASDLPVTGQTDIWTEAAQEVVADSVHTCSIGTGTHGGNTAICGASTAHVLATARLPGHVHTFNDTYRSGAVTTGLGGSTGTGTGTTSPTDNTTGTTGANGYKHLHNIPPLTLDTYAAAGLPTADGSTTYSEGAGVTYGSHSLQPDADKKPVVDMYCLAFIMFMGGGAEPGTEGWNWGGGSTELGRIG